MTAPVILIYVSFNSMIPHTRALMRYPPNTHTHIHAHTHTHTCSCVYTHTHTDTPTSSVPSCFVVGQVITDLRPAIMGDNAFHTQVSKAVSTVIEKQGWLCKVIMKLSGVVPWYCHCLMWLGGQREAVLLLCNTLESTFLQLLAPFPLIVTHVGLHADCNFCKL